jgi:hypothetical protein
LARNEGQPHAPSRFSTSPGKNPKKLGFSVTNIDAVHIMDVESNGQSAVGKGPLRPPPSHDRFWQTVKAGKTRWAANPREKFPNAHLHVDVLSGACFAGYSLW